MPDLELALLSVNLPLLREFAAANIMPIECEDVDSIYLASVRVRWQALRNMVMNPVLRISQQEFHV
jgi:hypothetical protein